MAVSLACEKCYICQPVKGVNLGVRTSVSLYQVPSILLELKITAERHVSGYALSIKHSVEQGKYKLLSTTTTFKYDNAIHTKN